MKLLFDANLSPALVGHLQTNYPGSTHVRDVGLRAGSDAQIWEYAKANELAIASKDSDFRERGFVEGFPPKVVWLDAGNAGTMQIAALLRTEQRRVEHTGVPQALYDRIGRTYTSTRHPDSRIAAAILRAIGDAHTVVNVGAGAGAYEPSELSIVAVEPSWQMIRQRAAGASPVVRASAEALPFRDHTFDAALALLTLHHWDWRRGLDEMRRVANRLVAFTFEPADVGNFWLTEVYFPEIVELDRGRCPSVADLMRHLGDCRVERIAIPHDCVDGFLAAYWCRPEAYLDPKVRAGISGFALLDPAVVTRGVARLEADLESGAWEERFGHLRRLEALDVCYRLLVAD